MLSRRGSGTEGTFPTTPARLCWARRKSGNIQYSTHPARTLRNLPILAPPGDHQGAPVVSFALRDLAFFLTQLFLPLLPPFIGTVTCPEMKSFILPSSHLWDVFALKTSCFQFLISDQLGRGQGMEAHAAHYLAARGTSLDFAVAAWGSCHHRQVHRPHSYTLNYHCEAVSLTGKNQSVPWHGPGFPLSLRLQLGEFFSLLGVHRV